MFAYYAKGTMEFLWENKKLKSTQTFRLLEKAFLSFQALKTNQIYASLTVISDNLAFIVETGKLHKSVSAETFKGKWPVSFIQDHFKAEKYIFHR